MVVSIHASTSSKSDSKTPAAELKRTVSSSPTHKVLEDEVLFLRSQNKMLKSALNAVKDTASEKLSKSYELVWYARNRTRFPTHPASKWLDHSKDHKDDIDKLHSMDGDFHHGFNSGVLAAARMFKDHAESADVDFDTNSSMKKNIEESKASFPDLSVNKFPEVKRNTN